jgi:hypothetical protein
MVVHGMVQFSNLSAGPWAGMSVEAPVMMQLAFEENPIPVSGGTASRYDIHADGSYIEIGEGAGAVRLMLQHFHPDAQLQISNGWPDSDALTTVPDVLGLDGSPYTFKIEAHKYLTTGSLWDTTSASDLIGNIYEHHHFDHVAFTIYSPPQGMLIMVHEIEISGGAHCDSIDFNHDHVSPDNQDFVDFLSVFSGGPCSNDPHCGDVDFNNDTVFPDLADVEMFLHVMAGGSCEG